MRLLLKVGFELIGRTGGLGQEQSTTPSASPAVPGWSPPFAAMPTADSYRPRRVACACTASSRHRDPGLQLVHVGSRQNVASRKPEVALGCAGQRDEQGFALGW